MSAAKTTTDHDRIRKWAESRGGHPALVETDQPGGILRIDFGEPEEGLKQVSWEEFFRVFDDNDLAFLYQDGDGESRFNKFVRPDQKH